MKSAPCTEAREFEFRWRTDFELGPHRLARVRSRRGAPAVGESIDEDKTSTGLGVGSRMLELREAVTPGVGDLDAEGWELLPLD
ncbi:hypothetical protein [Streptomyces canus]|uniref:hypothetical protein n=1 Tax=Streptomyces canus TaxID=58343 RepID=UPI003870559E